MADSNPGSDASGAGTLKLEEVERGEDRVVLDISGELDLHTAPRLKEELFEKIAAGTPHVVLSCAELRFVDSTGLGILVAAHKRATEQGGGIRIESPSRILSKLLSITKLDGVFLS